MESRTLEINLQYAKDLNKVNLFTKMDVYAVVSISGGADKKPIKSPVDHDGDENPNWSFPMTFTVDEAAIQENKLTLDIKLVCERVLGDKDVGEVHVPVKELFDSPAKGGAAGDGRRFVSYQVMKPTGKAKGQLTFSYKFGETVEAAAAVGPPYEAGMMVAPSFGKGEGEPMVAYPAGPSSAYPPPAHGAYPPPALYPVATAEGSGHYPPQAMYPPPGAYPPPPHGYGYPPPPPHGYGYPPPPQQGYGYPPQPGYGYPPQPGYGYPPQQVQQPQKKKSNNKFGMGLGAGLLGGALGGMLVGDMISDGDFGDGGGFDF